MIDLEELRREIADLLERHFRPMFVREVRLHCPDVLMGLHTRDELIDVNGEPEIIEPPRARVETLRPSPSSVRALQDASRPAPAPDRAGPSAPVAGPPPIAASPSSPAPRGGDPTRVEAAPEPTEGELQERAAIMASLLRMAEPRRKAAAERAMRRVGAPLGVPPPTGRCSWCARGNLATDRWGRPLPHYPHSRAQTLCSGPRRVN